jgi:AcrR family transcriptional regulator
MRTIERSQGDVAQGDGPEPDLGDERSEKVIDASPKRKRSDETRARILDSAEQVFGERGYHGASVVEITKNAGVGLGTFYIYFPSKIEIYRQLLRSRQEEFINASRRAYEGATDQREIIKGAFRAFFHWIGNRPTVLRLLREAEFVDPTLLPDLYTTRAEELRDRLARAIELGAIKEDDPDVLAWCVMGMTEFIALRYLVWTGKPEIDQERFESFARIVSRAIGADTDPRPAA